MSYFPDYSSLKTFDEWTSEWYEENCPNHAYDFAYKISETGRIMLYKQCVVCGHKSTSGSLKHSEVPNLKEKIQNNEISKFDVDLENSGPTWDKYFNEYKKPAMNLLDYKKEKEKKEEKDAWLKEHSEYLHTIEWQRIRQKVLKRDNYLCQGCLEAKATEVHHITYANWKNELMFELMSVCYNCHHNRIHK